MKKIFIILILLSSITACTKNKINNKETNNESTPNDTNIKEEEIIVDEYIDDNPIKVGLYQKNKLVKSYRTTLGNNKDIASFDVYYTNIDNVSGKNTKDNWKKYYNEYDNIDKYKIGFNIKFEVGDKTIEKNLLDASATYSMGPYLFVYLYDDINQPDSTWYSHLRQEDMKDNTILSSLKLYLGGEGSKITSPITLTVFTYDNDDFDEAGKYKGISRYTIEIETN